MTPILHRSILDRPPPPGVPPSIDGFLKTHGLDIAPLARAGGKFTVAGVDSHFAKLASAGHGVSPGARMQVKACLKQIGML